MLKIIEYSKEVSGDRVHAGEHRKKFIQKGKELHHEANVDMAGNVMNSNKGQTGSIIRIKDLIGIIANPIELFA